MCLKKPPQAATACSLPALLEDCERFVARSEAFCTRLFLPHWMAVEHERSPYFPITSRAGNKALLFLPLTGECAHAMQDSLSLL